MRISFIIVSFNTKEFLEKCLNSLEKSQEDFWKHNEIIVVDNNSQDESTEMVKRKFSKVNLIENKENFGFSKANNQGIKMAKGEYVFLLNSDTEIGKESLSEMIEFIKKNPQTGILAPRLLNPDGSIQDSVFYFPTIGGAIKQYWLGESGCFGKYAPQTSNTMEVEAVVGAAMLIPKKIINHIGLLDENYFMYFEDLDYCCRVKTAGYKILYYPGFQVTHYHGASGKTVLSKPSTWLIDSSKRYHGILGYWILTFVLWTGQKWQKIKTRFF